MQSSITSTGKNRSIQALISPARLALQAHDALEEVVRAQRRERMHRHVDQNQDRDGGALLVSLEEVQTGLERSVARLSERTCAVTP